MNIADVFNVSSEVKGPDGTVYKLRKPTLLEQGQFARWLEKRAHDAVDRSEATEAQKDRRHHLIDVDAGLGKYEYDGEIAMQALYTPAGMAKILAIVCADQGLTDEKAEALFLANAREVAARILMRAADDPKALRPLLGALGFPMNWLEGSGESDSSSSNSSTRPSAAPSPNSGAAPTTSSSSCTPSSAVPMG
jgi:hypothetical protein